MSIGYHRTFPIRSLLMRLALAGGIAGAMLSCASLEQTQAIDPLSEYFPVGATVRDVPMMAGSAPNLRLRVVEGRSGPLGYLAVQKCWGRSGSFMISVTMDRQFVVKRVDVTECTAPRDAEIRYRNFTGQFLGKGPADPIRVGEDIDAVTGATISSRSAANGVRRLVSLAKRTFGEQLTQGIHRPPRL